MQFNIEEISYVKNKFVKCNEDVYLPILRLSTLKVELRCKLQEKLHKVTATSATYHSIFYT